MNRIVPYFLVLAIFAFSALNAGADDAWRVNVDEGLKLAAKENKDVLVLFTGSDWCPPCKALESTVLSKEDFQKKALEKYVLIKLDFPRSSKVPEHNNEWSEKLSINGFPTVLLMDGKGRPFGKTGYGNQKPDAFWELLVGLNKSKADRDKFFAEAKKETDEGKKAQLIDKALNAVPEEYVSSHYGEYIKQIVSLDAKDKLGLRTKYYAAQDKEARKEIMAKITMAARSLSSDRALKVIDEAVGEMKLPPMMKVRALQYKLRLLTKMKRHDEAAKLLDDLIAEEGVEAEIQNQLLVQKAYVYVSSGKTDTAVEMLTKEIGSRINNMELLIAKGELLSRTGKNEEAIKEFDLALQSAGRDSDLLAEIISLKNDSLIELGRTDEAIEALHQFANNKKHDVELRSDAYVQKAMLLRELKKDDEATAAEQRALSLVEDDEEREALKKYIEQLKSIK